MEEQVSISTTHDEMTTIVNLVAGLGRVRIQVNVARNGGVNLVEMTGRDLVKAILTPTGIDSLVGWMKKAKRADEEWLRINGGKDEHE